MPVVVVVLFGFERGVEFFFEFFGGERCVGGYSGEAFSRVEGDSVDGPVDLAL